jgi:hypothetical protein
MKVTQGLQLQAGNLRVRLKSVTVTYGQFEVTLSPSVTIGVGHTGRV